MAEHLDNDVIKQIVEIGIGGFNAETQQKIQEHLSECACCSAQVIQRIKGGVVFREENPDHLINGSEEDETGDIEEGEESGSYLE